MRRGAGFRRESFVARAGALLLAFGTTTFAAPGAIAQDIDRPHLAGHTFLSTDMVPDAFIRTYVRNSVGYAAVANLDYPSVVVGGDTLLSLDGQLAYATLGFEYQQAVKDWIAVRIAVGGRTRVGTELSSIVIDGVTLSTGYDLAWLVRVHESDRTMLSGSLGLVSESYTRIDVRQFVEDVIAGTPNPKIIDEVPRLQSYGAAHFSWAISRPLGLTAQVRGLYGETPWRDEPEGWAYEYGLVLDFDGGPSLDLPLGVAIGYEQQSTPVLSNESEGARRASVIRIAYNAKPDFIVAVDLNRIWNSTDDRERRLTSSGAGLALRYYF